MGTNTATGEQNAAKFAADEQTGEVFELKPEARKDIEAATISIVYLIAMLIVFGWQFVDISTGRMLLLKKILGDNADKLNSDLCRIIAYAVIGGGFGGIVNGFRSILIWHADRSAFGWRYLWKYITLPLLGATLAAIVYALTRAGMAVIGGNTAGAGTPSGNDFVTQAFSAFAIGAASGYGSKQVFKWFDSHVNRWFHIDNVALVEVPELTGKTKQDALNALEKSQLNLGQTMEKTASNASEIDRVTNQSPAAHTTVPKAGSVDITVGKKVVQDVEVPDVTNNTQQQAEDALQKLGLKVNIKTQDSTDANEIGKVISQSPSARTKVTTGSEVTITVARRKD